MDAVSVELEEALRRAALAQPDLSADAQFVAFVVARMEPGRVPTHLSDMLVAHAAVRGNAKAVATVEAALHALPPLLGRFRLSEAELRDLLQELRLRLLVGTPAETEQGGIAEPRLLEYRGTGPLGAWLRAAAVRLVLSNFRATTRRREDELVTDDVLGTTDDAELTLAKQTYRAPLEEAFRTALRELASRDRTVLRMYLLDGRNIEEIGAVFRVHRATIARWISDARASLGKRTQAILTANFDTNTEEFRSITRLCYSQMDVSLHTLLASHSDQPATREP